MIAHTPGPWWVDRHGAVVASVGGESRQVAMAAGDAPMHGGPDATTKIQRANARLIAAAPEMRESLIDAMELMFDEAALLDAWAMESRDGGWSTHQVEPMKRRADDLRRRAEKVRAVLSKGDTGC